jgi:hypothetical protein
LLVSIAEAWPVGADASGFGKVRETITMHCLELLAAVHTFLGDRAVFLCAAANATRMSLGASKGDRN